MTDSRLARIEHVFELYHRHSFSHQKISNITGIPRSTIGEWLRNAENIKQFSHLLLYSDTSFSDTADPVSTVDVLTENAKLNRKVQRLQDTNRMERKTFREGARAENTLEILNAALLEVLKKNKLTEFNIPELPEPDNEKPVAVVHLSDLHFNELVDDVLGNKFDFKVASQRLQKYVHRTTRQFQAAGVGRVVVALTGDLLNSDRRLDEIVNAATNRSQAIFLAVDILQQVIQDYARHWKVDVVSVTGNESRVGEFVQWSSVLASDSYDIVIHNILNYSLIDHSNVRFHNVEDPLECVVKINDNCTFLLVHGHGHRGLANTNQLEQQVTALKAKWASRNVKVDYVICGHIHSAYISDNFARNSGLPGTNAYAEKALNLNGKSSQNAYIVYEDGSIDGIKVCLQNYDEYVGYPFNERLQAFFRETTSRASTVTIQSVLI